MADDSSAGTGADKANAFEIDAKAVESKILETIDGLFRKVDQKIDRMFEGHDDERRYADIVMDQLEAAFTKELKEKDLIAGTIGKLNTYNAALIAATEKFQDDAIKAVVDAAENFDTAVLTKLLPALDGAFGTWSDALETWLGQIGALGVETVSGLAEVVRDSALKGIRNAAEPVALELLDDIFDWRSVRDRLKTFGDIDLSLSRTGLAPAALGMLSTAQAGLGPEHLRESQLTGLIGVGSGLFGPDGLGSGFSSTLGTDLVGKMLEQFPATSEWLGLATPGYYDFAGSWTDFISTTGLGDALATGINSAGWGAVGSLGANLLGLHPRDPIVGAVASGLGSVAGGTLGALGSTAGGMLSFLGSFGGPAGAIGGSFLATALSSQFGPNPSVGPNGSAYLGFSNGTFTLGGSGSDNGGSSAEYERIVGEAAAVLNDGLDKLGLFVRDPSQSFWSFGAGTAGVAPASYVESSDALVSRVLSSGRFGSDIPEVELVLADLSGTAEQMLQALAEAASFQSSLEAVRQEASPTALAATTAFEEQVDKYGQVIDTAKRIGEEATGQAKEAVKGSLEVKLGITEAAEPLSEIESILEALGARAEAAGNLLAEVGITAEQAADGSARLKAALGEFVSGRLQSELDRIQGFGSVEAVRDLLARRDGELRDAKAVGIDTGVAEDLFGARLQQVLDGQSLPALQRLIDTFGEIPAVADAAQGAYDALAQSVQQGFEAQLNTLTGLGILSEVTALLRQADRSRQQASDAGLSPDLVEALAAEQLEHALEGQTLPALRRVIDAFAAFPKVAEAARAALEDLSASIREGFDARINSLSGLAVLNDVGALIARGPEDLQLAAEAGVETARVRELYRLELEGMLGGQGMRGLEAVADAFGDIPLVAEVAAAAVADLTASIREGFDARINSLSGLGVVNDVAALIARGPEDLQLAAEAGVETAKVRELYRLELERMLGGQAMPGLEAVMDAFGDIPLVAQTVQAAIRDLQARAVDDYRQLMDGARTAALAAWQDQAREAESLMDSMRGLAEGLARTRQDLATGSLSPLGPQARLQELAAQFGDTASRARLGDREALGDLSGIAQTYLSAARDYYAATEPYAEIFAEVQDSLAAAEGTATRHASVAEQQLDAAQRQIELLEEMAAALGAAGSGNPLADYFGAVAAGSDADRQQALARMTPDQMAGALAQFAPGSQEQERIRRFLGETEFGDGTQAALREQWQRLGEEVLAGTATGDVMGRQLSILARADAESLEQFISVMNPKGQNTAAARAFLMQYQNSDVRTVGADAAIAGLGSLAHQLDVQTAALRLGNAELGGALGEVRVLLQDILQQVKNGGLAA